MAPGPLEARVVIRPLGRHVWVWSLCSYLLEVGLDAFVKGHSKLEIISALLPGTLFLQTGPYSLAEKGCGEWVRREHPLAESFGLQS